MPEINAPIPDDVQRSVRRAYYASVTWVDYQIGRVLAVLDELNLTEKTIVLLHGDHGKCLGCLLFQCFLRVRHN